MKRESRGTVNQYFCFSYCSLSFTYQLIDILANVWETTGVLYREVALTKTLQSTCGGMGQEVQNVSTESN